MRLRKCIPIVFPLHPRTRQQLASHGLERALVADPGVILCEPLGYLDFIGLAADAKLVLTDSGGIQEETTVLGVPCLRLRESTERSVTVSSGTNRVVGTDPDRIVEEALTILEGRPAPARIPELWDGYAGQRIVDHLRSELWEDVRVASSLG